VDELEEIPTGQPEVDRVDAWRLRFLLDAGYPLHLAERMARDRDVDLHKAAKLLAQGCKPELAAEILL
jgi:hypothetical protein